MDEPKLTRLRAIADQTEARYSQLLNAYVARYKELLIEGRSDLDCKSLLVHHLANESQLAPQEFINMLAIAVHRLADKP